MRWSRCILEARISVPTLASSPHSLILFGRIVEIVEESRIHVAVGARPYAEVLAFAPKLLEGYEGQALLRLGVAVDAPVRLQVDRDSNRVTAAAVL
jgi:hypothetical protein